MRSVAKLRKWGIHTNYRTTAPQALCYALMLGGQSVAAAKSAEQEKVGTICCSRTFSGSTTGTREGDSGRGGPARSLGGGWRCRR
jgi:hypothetical protein